MICYYLLSQEPRWLNTLSAVGSDLLRVMMMNITCEIKTQSMHLPYGTFQHLSANFVAPFEIYPINVSFNF